MNFCGTELLWNRTQSLYQFKLPVKHVGYVTVLITVHIEAPFTLYSDLRSPFTLKSKNQKSSGFTSNKYENMWSILGYT